MKADISTSISNTSRRSASSTTAESAKTAAHGPLPGKGPWVRVDGIWYTKDEADKWVEMPGQADIKPKRAYKARG